MLKSKSKSSQSDTNSFMLGSARHTKHFTLKSLFIPTLMEKSYMCSHSPPRPPRGQTDGSVVPICTKGRPSTTAQQSLMLKRGNVGQVSRLEPPNLPSLSDKLPHLWVYSRKYIAMHNFVRPNVTNNRIQYFHICTHTGNTQGFFFLFSEIQFVFFLLNHGQTV